MDELKPQLSDSNKNTQDNEPHREIAPSRRTALQTAGVAGLGLFAASAAMTPRNAEASSAAIVATCKLAANTAVGATSLTVNTSAGTITATPGRGWIIIDAFTPDCEIRRITSVTTTAVTFAGPLQYAHAINDFVLWSETGDNNVTFFGAKGDATIAPGSTDDSLAINRAILSASLTISTGSPLVPVHTGSRVVVFPKAAYRILSSIAVNANFTTSITAASVVYSFAFKADDISLIGNSSVINLDNPALSHFTVGDNVTTRKGIRIDGFSISCLDSSPAAASGAGFLLQWTAGVIISNCRISGKLKMFNGISISRGIQNEIHNCQIVACLSNGIALVGTGVDDNKTNDIVISSSRIEDCAVAGLNTGQWVEGLYVRNTIFYNNQNHVNVDGTSINTGCVSYKFLSCDFDTTRYANPGSGRPGGYGIVLKNVSNVQICDSWFSNNERQNIFADGTVFELVITSNQILKNTKYFPQVSYDYPVIPPNPTVLATTWNVDIGAKSVVISGNLIKGGTDCIILQATAKVITITGNQISGNTPTTDTVWGVNNFLNPDRVTIIGNTFAYITNLLTNVAISSGGTNISALAGTNNLATLSF
jgi:Right handed beta helix region